MRLLLISALALVSALPGAAQRNKPSEPYALITGTVFRDTGAALPGAEVILAPDGQPGAAKGKPKKAGAVSDSRGEFAIRVPAGQNSYTLTVRAKGYREQQKPVSTTGEDRIDVFFRLDPASN